MDELISNGNVSLVDADFQSLAGLALESAQDEILWTDACGRLIYANRIACATLEYPREELLSMTVSDICPDLPPHIWAEQWQALKAAGQMVLQVRQRSRSGKFTLMEVSATYTQHDGKEYSCAFGRDITDRTCVEEELKKREHQFSSLADNLPDLVSRIDRTHRHVYVNRQAEAISGIPVNSYLGKTNRELGMPEEIVELWEDAVNRAFDTGEIVKIRFALPTDVGTKYFESRIVPEEGADGAVETVLNIARDITEAVLADQQLMKSEERYRTIIENMQDVYYRTDAEGRLIMISPSGATILGYDNVEQILGRDIRNTFYYDPEERDAFIKNLRIKGELSGYELTLKHRNGTPLPVATSSHLLFAPDGTFMGVEGVYRNIIQFRKAMDQLKASEDKFARAFNHAPVLMTISGIEDGRYLEVNDRFCEVSGFSRQEALGRTSLEVGWLSVAERERMIAAFKRDGQVSGMEMTLTAKNGTPVYCLYSAELITAEGEDQLLSIALDITERKRSEEKIRQQAQFLELAHDNIIVRDKDDRIIYWNRGAEECYGWKREEAQGQVIHSLFKTCFPIPLEEIQRLLIQNGMWQGELIHARRDGTQITVSSRWSRICNDLDGTIAVLEINRDVSDRMLLQQEQEKNQRLESLGVLAGGIAHDFNNILTTILGNISLTRILVGDEHKAAQRLADSERAVTRARELTQQLLTFARGGEPVKRVVDTLKLIGEAVGFALQGANVKGVIEAESELYPVNADEGQLNQVFNNLLINAKQAMPAGGTVIVTAKNLNVHSEDRLPLASGIYVQIDIADQGDGIPPDQLGKIFDPYFTTKANGTGLGLSTVYSIIKRHGGHISVTSEYGHGTVFRLFLPAVEEAHAPQETNQTPQGLLSGTGRILLMDDEQFIRDVVRSMLEEGGYQVVECEHGAEAAEQYRLALEQGARFDAVILDLTVPGGMGGREAAALIRTLDPKAVLIVSSGYSNDPVMADFGRYGFSGAAVKPYTFEALMTELSHAMGHTPRA